MSDELVKRLRDHIAVVIDNRGHVFEDEYLCDIAADRIAKLEAKLEKAVELDTVKMLVTSAYKEGWSDGCEFVSLDVGWENSLTRATLAELEDKTDD